jgi:replicative DNA helicase
MDSEQRFIYALLAANRHEQNRFYAQQIPKGVFKLREVEIGWIYRYRDLRGAYPSINLFNHKFSEDPVKKHKDSLSGTLQPILEMAMFTQMSDLTKKVKKKLDADEDVASALEYFKSGASKLNTFSVDYVDIDFKTTRGTLGRYKKRVKDIATGSKHLLDSPWPTFTKLVKYFTPGETVVLAARTSMGKSWLTMFWAEYYAAKGIPTLYISKEMPTEQCEDRQECLHFKLDYEKFREGNLHPKEIARWHKARREKIEHPLIISGDETVEGVGLEHVISKIQQYRPQVCVIDGAYLISPKGLPAAAKEHEKYGYISNRLKAVAKATGTLIIIVIQMNRNAEKKDGTTRGTISDLYGSDRWAQDADWVIDLNGKRGSKYRTVCLLKGRESSVGEFNVKFRLSPYPDFSEAKGLSAKQPTGKVQFLGIS